MATSKTFTVGFDLAARFDSDKMLDQMSKKMEKTATTAVSRAIGQGRT